VLQPICSGSLENGIFQGCSRLRLRLVSSRRRKRVTISVPVVVRGDPLGRRIPTYRLHAHDGYDLELLEHPAPNVEAGDVVMLADGRKALVTSRVDDSPFVALLQVVMIRLTPRQR
jgi:hypothetical protein